MPIVRNAPGMKDRSSGDHRDELRLASQEASAGYEMRVSAEFHQLLRNGLDEPKNAPILVVGSGVGAVAGVPTWHEVTKALRAANDELPQRGAWPTLDAVFARGEQHTLRFLQEMLLGAKPRTFHRELMQYPWSGIATISIDKVLEQTDGFARYVQFDVLGANAAPPVPWYARLFSDYLHLTRLAGHQQVQAHSDRWLQALRSLLVDTGDQRAIIFIGVSPVADVVDALTISTSARNGERYLLTMKDGFDQEAGTRLSGRGVHVVEFPNSDTLLDFVLRGIRSSMQSFPNTDDKDPTRPVAAAAKHAGRLQREAGAHELTLDVDLYAEELAKVLVNADGELCFALFGPWGRGKTTLIRRVYSVLRRKGAAHSYDVAWFNAWKYRTPAEVWAHLYERFATSSRKGGWLRHTVRTLRANIVRFGTGPIAVGLLGLAATLLPSTVLVSAAAQVALRSLQIVGGLATLFWVGHAMFQTSLVLRNVWTTYGSLPSHADKLGLQAAIGRDLKSLLDGWVRPGQREGGALDDEPDADHR